MDENTALRRKYQKDRDWSFIAQKDMVRPFIVHKN